MSCVCVCVCVGNVAGSQLWVDKYKPKSSTELVSTHTQTHRYVQARASALTHTHTHTPLWPSRALCEMPCVCVNVFVTQVGNPGVIKTLATWLRQWDAINIHGQEPQAQGETFIVQTCPYGMKCPCLAWQNVTNCQQKQDSCLLAATTSMRNCRCASATVLRGLFSCVCFVCVCFVYVCMCQNKTVLYSLQ